MIVQFHRVDGTMKVEKTRLNARYIEMPDGYHPITNDSVWQDDKRMRQPLMVIVEGVLGPMGADMTETDVSGMLKEVEIVKRSHKPQHISRMWMRRIQQFFDFIASRGLPTLILIFIGYVLYSAFAGGEV